MNKKVDIDRDDDEKERERIWLIRKRKKPFG